MSDNYIFPENNWYIEITDDNRKVVNDWKIKQQYNDDLFENLDYKYVNCGSGGRGGRLMGRGLQQNNL